MNSSLTLGVKELLPNTHDLFHYKMAFVPSSTANGPTSNISNLHTIPSGNNIRKPGPLPQNISFEMGLSQRSTAGNYTVAQNTRSSNKKKVPRFNKAEENKLLNIESSFKTKTNNYNTDKWEKIREKFGNDRSAQALRHKIYRLNKKCDKNYKRKTRLENMRKKLKKNMEGMRKIFSEEENMFEILEEKDIQEDLRLFSTEIEKYLLKDDDQTFKKSI